MSEPTFEQLHPGAASTITTGVDIAGVVSTDMALQAMLDGGLSGGSGADAVAILPPPPKLSSFSVYWDDTSKAYMLHNPLVYVQGSPVAVAAEDRLAEGTYFCNITESDGTYTAEVKDSQDDKALASIKICEIADNKVTQYHVGAIVCDIIGSKLEIKKKDDTSGSILLDASGDSPKLVLSEGGKSVNINLSEMPSGDSQEYKFRDITWKTSSASEDESASADESTQTAHVIADKDIDLTKIGGAATLTLVGNSSANEVVCKTGKITFASADDSNVVITPVADEEGNVTVTIGVYYK